MAQRAFCEQCVRIDQRLDNRAIGIAVLARVRQNALARKQRHMIGIGTIFADHVERIGNVTKRRFVGNIQTVIIIAMTGRGVHKACARFSGDMIAGQQAHIKIITLPAQRMRRAQTRRVHLFQTLQGNFCVLGDNVGQLVGEQQFFANIRKRTILHVCHFKKRIRKRCGIGDGAIGRNGPRRCRPDDNTRALVCAVAQRKLHINRGRLFLVILNLGLG